VSTPNSVENINRVRSQLVLFVMESLKILVEALRFPPTVVKDYLSTSLAVTATTYSDSFSP
jgi:hypothetical protein